VYGRNLRLKAKINVGPDVIIGLKDVGSIPRMAIMNIGLPPRAVLIIIARLSRKIVGNTRCNLNISSEFCPPTGG